MSHRSLCASGSAFDVGQLLRTERGAVDEKPLHLHSSGPDFCLLRADPKNFGITDQTT